MPYISLYRKYRSQTFEDVMGQEHVTRTLQNAIRLGKVSHAYLFCGTRGTGKTTTARLLAKALNCEKGPTPDPCNECSPCVSITEGTAIDIMELDAASHRGIDDVKDIRENVKFPPMELRYKIFIIDEAHQLSKDAKDAFLKTLEEPPAYAIFILATTEPQSIPITIRSRCQQFDFRRGSLQDIRKRLRFVAASEAVEAKDAALDLIASNADGSWRDALSLLEQVLAYTDGRVTVEDVNTVLGTVSQDFLFRLADTVADADESGAFRAAEEAVESGKDVQQLLKSISQHFRNLLFASVTSRLSDITTNEEVATKLREQASRFSSPFLLRAVEIFSQAERDARYSDQHRLLLELAVLKAMQISRPVRESPSQVAQPATPAESLQPKPAPQPKQESDAKPETATRGSRQSEARATTSGQQELPEFDKIKGKWERVVQHVKSIHMPSYALLRDVTPVGVRDGALVLHFKHEGHVHLISNGGDKNPKRKSLLTAIERVFGVPNARLICETAPAAEKQSPAPKATARSDDDDLPNPFEGDPSQETLKNVLEIFNGTIVDDT